MALTFVKETGHCGHVRKKVHKRSGYSQSLNCNWPQFPTPVLFAIDRPYEQTDGRAAIISLLMLQ